MIEGGAPSGQEGAEGLWGGVMGSENVVGSVAFRTLQR